VGVFSKKIRHGICSNLYILQMTFCGCILVTSMKFCTQGVNERSYNQLAGFREMIDVCGLCDLGYRGVGWTFEKKVSGSSFCRTRLDRALASPSWCARYPAAKIQHLAAVATSDHLPILLRREQMRGTRGKKPFHYGVACEGAGFL
jgi:hypothetical protein